MQHLCVVREGAEKQQEFVVVSERSRVVDRTTARGSQEPTTSSSLPFPVAGSDLSEFTDVVA
jgi:hypothetical protein